MKIALSAKNKLKLVDISMSEPRKVDKTYVAW